MDQEEPRDQPTEKMDVDDQENVPEQASSDATDLVISDVSHTKCDAINPVPSDVNPPTCDAISPVPSDVSPITSDAINEATLEDSPTICDADNPVPSEEKNEPEPPPDLGRDQEVENLDENDQETEEADVRKRSLDEVEATDDPPLKKNKKEEEKENGEETTNEIDGEKRRKRSPELAKFWKTVEDDPSDFSGWTYLLQFIDSHGDLAEGREAFDAFLFKYPYCYGYWKKYADFEKRNGSKETCVAVFERGVAAIPLSADLWIHYLNYAKAEFSVDEILIRQTYDRAVKACGREWRSDKLWDHYVKWELSLQEEASPKDYRRVLKLYDEILLNPTQGLAPQFDMFRDFVKDHLPSEMLDPVDFLLLRKEVLEALSGDEKREVGDGEEGVPGVSAARNDEEILAMKEKMIHSRRKVFKETEIKVQARWKFEENIKRPYFHIKPLERAQLANWTDYIEFQLKQNDPALAEILFERCLIACALYEEYWIKYTDWMVNRIEDVTKDEAEKLELIEKTRDIFFRACTYHLPSKVDIHLAWSAFEERYKNFDKAIEILNSIEKHHPKLMSLTNRKINAQRRCGNLTAVHAIYKDFIDGAKSASHRSDWSVKYSRFLRLQCADETKAVKVLEDAIAVDETNPKLHLQVIRSPVMNVFRYI